MFKWPTEVSFCLESAITVQTHHWSTLFTCFCTERRGVYDVITAKTAGAQRNRADSAGSHQCTAILSSCRFHATYGAEVRPPNPPFPLLRQAASVLGGDHARKDGFKRLPPCKPARGAETEQVSFFTSMSPFTLEYISAKQNK